MLPASVPIMTLPMLATLVFLAPFTLAVFFGLGRLSQTGQAPSLRAALADARRHAGALASIGLVLTLTLVAGIRLTAIAVALTLEPVVPATVFDAPFDTGLAPALVVGTTATVAVLLGITTFSVAAVHAWCIDGLAGIAVGASLLRRNLPAVLLWVALILALSAAAAWVTPLILVVGVALAAYSHRHAFRLAVRRGDALDGE